MSAAEYRTVTTDDGAFTYDPDMPMGVLRALSAGPDATLDGMLTALGQMLQTWPFEGDPKVLDDWNAIRRSQFTSITKAVMEDLEKLGEE